MEADREGEAVDDVSGLFADWVDVCGLNCERDEGVSDFLDGFGYFICAGGEIGSESEFTHYVASTPINFLPGGSVRALKNFKLS